MRGALVRSLHAMHRLWLGGARRRFEIAARDCERVQAAKLQSLLARNANTAYGQLFGFEGIRSPRDWQSRVPVVTYDEIESWVRRAAAGDPNVLTAEPVRVFEETSGSTSAAKLVPYTKGMLAEFGEATGPWLHDLYSSIPALAGTRSYWSVSPVSRLPRRTLGGTAIGFEDDSEYFGPIARAAIRQTLAVPPSVARIGDIDAWRLATMIHLAGAEDLGLVSVWHPSFFTLLLDALRRRLDDVLAELPAARARAIRDRVGRMPLAEALWPRLALVSCWADGPAAAPAAALAREVPHARLQGKGLLSTEGVVSFPLHMGPGVASFRVAAVNSHVLEFEDLDGRAERPLFAHQLRVGGMYTPILSTAAGFYRYRTGDAVRCVGHHGTAPLLEFVGRTDQGSDLCGEKLNAVHVGVALAAAARDAGVSPTFALLAPTHGAPGYRLYVDGLDESQCAAMRDALERALCDNPGYAHARALGQLARLDAALVTNGAERYQEARVERGERAGNVKPAHLDATLDWARVFGVADATTGAAA